MKLIKRLILGLLSICFVSCFGDRKAINISEMNDTSFVNKSFKGNLINYSKDMSACEQLSVNDIASFYNVSSDNVIFQDASKSDRKAPNTLPICSFFIKEGKSDFQWLRGSMSVVPEVRKNEMTYEVAKATGNGEEWQEAWALNRSISKSSEWVKNIGKAAVWKESSAELKIKFEGYVLKVYPLKNKLNTNEVAKHRDYKKIAIEMVKAAGYIN